MSLGVVPTPAVAYLTRTEGFDLGIVISASHNPFQDNGIKVFSGAGEKFSAAQEQRIEAIVADASWQVPAGTHAPGTDAELTAHYVAHLRQILAGAGPLAGAPLVIDCAHGATTTLAPAPFPAPGFDVRPLGHAHAGRTSTPGDGRTATEGLAAAVGRAGRAGFVGFGCVSGCSAGSPCTSGVTAGGGAVLASPCVGSPGCRGAA